MNNTVPNSDDGVSMVYKVPQRKLVPNKGLELRSDSADLESTRYDISQEKQLPKDSKTNEKEATTTEPKQELRTSWYDIIKAMESAKTPFTLEKELTNEHYATIIDQLKVLKLWDPKWGGVTENSFVGTKVNLSTRIRQIMSGEIPDQANSEFIKNVYNKKLLLGEVRSSLDANFAKLILAVTENQSKEYYESLKAENIQSPKVDPLSIEKKKEILGILASKGFTVPAVVDSPKFNSIIEEMFPRIMLDVSQKLFPNEPKMHSQFYSEYMHIKLLSIPKYENPPVDIKWTEGQAKLALNLYGMGPGRDALLALMRRDIPDRFVEAPQPSVYMVTDPNAQLSMLYSPAVAAQLIRSFKSFSSPPAGISASSLGDNKALALATAMPIFFTMAEKYKIPHGILEAIWCAESLGDGSSLSRSSVGAGGGMQIMPKTWNSMMKILNRPDKMLIFNGNSLGVKKPDGSIYTLKPKGNKIDRNDPRADISLSIEAAAAYIKYLENPKVLNIKPTPSLKDYITLISAGYNAGEGNVLDAGRRVPDIGQTKKYVQKVAYYFSEINKAIDYNVIKKLEKVNAGEPEQKQQ